MKHKSVKKNVKKGRRSHTKRHRHTKGRRHRHTKGCRHTKGHQHTRRKYRMKRGGALPPQQPHSGNQRQAFQAGANADTKNGVTVNNLKGGKHIQSGGACGASPQGGCDMDYVSCGPNGELPSAQFPSAYESKLAFNAAVISQQATANAVYDN